MRILFVCLGNICRSPMAEAVFRKKVKEAGLDNEVSIESAATGDWHIGEQPHQGTLKKLDEKNVDASGLKARQLDISDFEKFDYIIGMDAQNVHDIRKILHQPTSSKILRFMDLTDEARDIPDPYYSGNFEETYEMVSKGCDALLAIVREQLQHVKS